DAAAYLRLLANPRDEVSLRRIVNYPTRGIGRTTLLRLAEAARARREPLSAVITAAREVEGVTGAQAEAVERFVETMDAARAELAAVEAEVASGAATDAGLERWVAGFVRSLGLE